MRGKVNVSSMGPLGAVMRFRGWQWLVIVFAAAVLVGCGSDPKKPVEEPDLVWPPPPEEPRIKYLKSYRGQSDFKDDSSFKNMLLGVDRAGIHLEKPYGVAINSNGSVMYVTDTKLGRVVIFDLGKGKVRFMPMDATGSIPTPVEVRVDGQDRVYLTGGYSGKVNVYSPEGETLLSLGKKEGMVRPTGLAVDEARNRMYVADTGSHHIVVYTLDGDFVKYMGQRGSAPGDFNFPISLAVDGDGKLYVVDSGNFRVQVFGADGEYVTDFGEIGDAFGSFSRPKGIGVDSQQHIYVLDAAFNNYQIFNQDGDLMLFVGALGRRPGMFWLPTGMYVDGQDRIYIADSINARVQVFQYLKSDEEGESAAE